MKIFLTGIKVTQVHGFNRAAIAAYWKRSYRSLVEKEPWYLLTNFSTLEETLKAYRKRVGIEVRNALPHSSLNAFKLGRQLCSKIVKREDII
jgi:hypothetical protein